MIQLKERAVNNLNAPVRQITAKAELLCGNSASATIGGTDAVLINNAHATPHQVSITTTAGAEVKVYGKNLITYPYFSTTGTYNGVQFTVNNDGSVTTTGTATDRIVFYFTVNANGTDVYIPNGYKVTLSGTPIEGVVSGKATIQTTNGTHYPTESGNGITFTSGGGKYRTYIVIEKDSVLSNAVFKPQMEISDTRTVYEPYKSITTVTADGNGKATVNSLSPNMTIIATTAGTKLSVDYTSTIEGDNCVFTHNGDLKEITVDRVGDNTKFFGYGVSQKVNIKVRDVARQYNITTNNFFRISFDDVAPLPLFYVTETHRDETTNELSITAYDKLYKAANHTLAELDVPSYYCVGDMITLIANFLKLNVEVVSGIDLSFKYIYKGGANFEGTETLREVLDDCAEATQCIYYCNEDTIVFRRLDIAGEPVLTIDKSMYFELDSKDNRRLSAICSATELGDNVIAESGITGTTQYIRDNAFWNVREDIANVVETALGVVNGLTVNQFSCSWRGNYLLEIGDKIAFVTKDNKTAESYFIHDKIVYNGAFEQSTEWLYQANDAESVDNPSTIGEALKYTFAKVDKINREIALVASETENNSNKIAKIEMDTESIKNSVERVDKKIDDEIATLGDDITEVRNKVELAITAEDLTIEVEKQITGINSIETTTGFKFNEDGLTVSKSGKEMTTTISEDGMIVYKNSDAVLTADNTGVKAVNLHANTYLIIGENSRFEDYGSGRTGCFWIGG